MASQKELSSLEYRASSPFRIPVNLFVFLLMFDLCFLQQEKLRSREEARQREEERKRAKDEEKMKKAAEKEKVL